MLEKITKSWPGKCQRNANATYDLLILRTRVNSKYDLEKNRSF